MTHDDTSIQSSPDENTRSISLEHQLVRDAFEQFEDSSTDTVQPSSIDIPGYDILRELHRGGQGVVYLAHQKSTKRQVAIKLLLHGNFATPKARKRFEREVELVAQLDHPNIISIFDSGQTEQGMQFFVMDYIRGDQLRDHVRKNEMSVEEVIRLFQKICDAVQYAHQRGVIHRDLKPSNILVDPNGEPKVLDFGLAKSLENAEETIATISQDIVGTLPYMSPEQASGDGVGLDTRTDVYSLGVILYEILTGQYPYPVAGRMADVLRHIAETQPSPLSQAWNANSGVHERSTSRRSSVSSRRSGRSKCPIDGGMEVIVLTAIAKNKDRRYQSAGELGRDLDRYLKGEALYAKGDSLGYRMIVELKRRRRTLGSAAAILIAIAGVATYASARQNAILAEQEKRDADLARLLARASVENNWGEIEQAESLLEEALALEPGYWKALYERALLRKDLYFQRIPGDPELLAQAEADIRQVIPQQPNALRVHNLAAVIFTALGKGEEAIEAAEQVVRLEPPTDPRPRPNYRSVLAKALAADGRLNEALAAVEEGVSFANDAPNRFSRWYSGVYRTLAILRWVVGEGDAQLAAQHSLQCDASDERNYLIAAKIAIAYGERAEALNVARQCYYASLPSGDPRAARTYAEALTLDESWEEAIQIADFALEIGDEPAYGHLIRAIALSRIGRPEDAKTALDNAEAQWPDWAESGFAMNIMRGILWFDRMEDLESLKAQAQALIDVR